MKLATATWCAPCKALKAKLQSLGVKIETKDIDNDPEFFKEHEIRSVPTLVKDDGTLITSVEKIENELL